MPLKVLLLIVGAEGAVELLDAGEREKRIVRGAGVLVDNDMLLEVLADSLLLYAAAWVVCGFEFADAGPEVDLGGGVSVTVVKECLREIRYTRSTSASVIRSS